MNKLRLLPFLLAVLFLTVLTGCDKDDDKEPTRTALLTSQIWQGNRAFVDDQDVTSFIDIDNTTMLFRTDGTYNIVISGSSNTGTWEFTSNEQKLLLDKGTNDEFTIDILRLTATNLDVEWTQEDTDTGETHTIEIRMIH